MSDVHTVHNPEKLEFKVRPYEHNTYTIGTDDGEWLMVVRHNGEQVEARQIANMRRLVGCWNALHDLPQDAIVGGWTRAGLEAYGIAMQADRDRLLEALQAMSSSFHDVEYMDEHKKISAQMAKDAIAKATRSPT